MPGWGEQPVLQLNCYQEVCTIYCFTMSMPIEWSTICIELKDKYILLNALDLVKCKWEELNPLMGEHIAQLKVNFCGFCLKLDPH